MGSLPEEMPKRTHKFWSALFLVGLVVQGVFFAVSPVSADTAAMNPSGSKDGWDFTPSPVTDQVNTGGGNKNNQADGAQKPPTACKMSLFPGDILTCVVQSVLLGVRSFAAWLAGGAAGLMVWVLDPANMSGPSGILNKSSIYELWKFIRDFFNLFFILILLLSAFATVFQIDNFSIRRIFLNLLYAALIINFSFPITRFLIDITNVPMYYFLQMIVPGADSGGLKLTEIFLGASGISATMVSPGDDFALLLMNIVFLFLFAISLLVLAVLFLVRLIALTLLLVFSPIGFAATLLPGMQKMGQEWWEKFWTYAFFGPSAALILLVSVRFMNQVGTDETYQRAKQVAIGMSAGNPEANQVTQVIFFSIPLILIWTAIGMANKSSIAGAGFVTGLGYGAAKKVGGWVKKGAIDAPWSAVKGTAKYVDRKIEKKMAATPGLRWLSPRVVATAVKNRMEEQEHKDEAVIKQGAARVQDKLNKAASRFVTPNPKRWFRSGIDVTNHEFEEAQHQAAEERKHISDVSTNGDYVINELKDAIANGQVNKADAAIQILAQNNDLNDMLVSIGKEYGAAVDKNGEVIVSSENMLKVLPEILRRAGESNAELLAQRMLVVGERATGSGNYAFGGMVQFKKDSHGHGKFEVATADEQAQWAAGKVKNLETQKRQTTLHPDSLFTRTSKGFGDINGEVAKEIIGTFTGADVAQAERSRDDLKEAIHKAYQRGGDTQFMEMYKSNQIFKQYVQSIVKMKRGMDYKGKMSSEEFEEKNPSGVEWPSEVVEAESKKKDEESQEVKANREMRERMQARKEKTKQNRV